MKPDGEKIARWSARTRVSAAPGGVLRLYREGHGLSPPGKLVALSGVAQQIEPEVAPERLLDHLALAFSGASAPEYLALRLRLAAAPLENPTAEPSARSASRGEWAGRGLRTRIPRPTEATADDLPGSRASRAMSAPRPCSRSQRRRRSTFRALEGATAVVRSPCASTSPTSRPR